MKHLNELTLLALVKNSLDKDEARQALLHIEQCDICLKKLRLIKIAIAPQKPVEPSKDVLSSILHYYSSQLQYYDKKTFKNTISNFVQTYRRSIAFTFSILIVGILITIFILKPGYKSIPHILYVADIKGKNVLTQTLIEGQRIKLKVSDSAMLVANNDIRFQLSGGTDLTITKSYFNKSIAKKTFQYEIYNGTANIKSFSSHQNMHYEIKTPDAVIQPLGTEFYINVSPEGTHIYIVEGRIALKNLTTNETVEAECGKLYTITQNNITSFDIEKYELQWVNDIDAAFNDLSQNLGFGEFSIINDNINENTGKEKKDITNSSSIPSSDSEIDIDESKTPLKKDDINDVKELQNETRELKKQFRHSMGR